MRSQPESWARGAVGRLDYSLPSTHHLPVLASGWARREQVLGWAEGSAVGKVKGLPPGGQLGVWGSPGCASPGILGEKGVSRPGGWKAPTLKSLLFRGPPSWGGGGMPPRISAAEGGERCRGGQQG